MRPMKNRAKAITAAIIVFSAGLLGGFYGAIYGIAMTHGAHWPFRAVMALGFCVGLGMFAMIAAIIFLKGTFLDVDKLQPPSAP